MVLVYNHPLIMSRIGERQEKARFFTKNGVSIDHVEHKDIMNVFVKIESPIVAPLFILTYIQISPVLDNVCNDVYI